MSSVLGAFGGRFFGALQFKEFRTLWAANLSGSAAAWALIVARGWEAFSISGSSVWVGLVTFSAMIPLFLVPPVVGVLADRFERRRLLAFSFLTNLLHNLGLVSLALTGVLEVWHLVPLGFVNGIGRASAMPAAQSLLPNLVPKEKMANAIALNQATQHGSRLTGPLIILPLMVTVGPEGAYVMCSVFYGLGLALVLRLRTSSTGSVDSQQGTIRNLSAGLSYVYRQPLVLSIIMLTAAHCCLTMSFESVLPVLSQGLGGGASRTSFSLLMIGVGAGAIISVMALAASSEDLKRGPILFFTAIGSGLSVIALAIAPNMPLAMISAMAVGGTQAAFMTITLTLIQTMVPDGIRGRVTSLYLWHIGGVMALANLVNGSIVDRVGTGWVLTISGAAFVTVTLMSLMRPKWRELYRGGSPMTSIGI